MTPYEFADLAQTSFGNSMTCFALMLSVVSGYLVTTYLIGADLSRFQVALLTAIFLFVMVFLGWSMSAYIYWGAVFAAQGSSDAAVSSFFTPGMWAVGAVVVTSLFTITICLLFMWNVRTSKE